METMGFDAVKIVATVKNLGEPLITQSAALTSLMIGN